MGERINEWQKEIGHIIIRDFNVSIAKLGGENIKEGEIERYNKDKIVENAGISWNGIIKKRWNNLNGRIEGE